MTIKQQYSKQRRRIQQTIRYYKKRGFDVEIDLPSIPKRITRASVRRLSNITSSKIREKTYTADLDTGEKITVHQYRIRFPKAKSPKQIYDQLFGKSDTDIQAQYISSKLTEYPKSYQVAIDTVINIVSDYPDVSKQILMSKIQSAISIYGEKNVGIVLEKMLEEDKIPTPKEAYNVALIIDVSNTLIKYLELTESEANKVLRGVQLLQEEQEWYEGEFDEW